MKYLLGLLILSATILSWPAFVEQQPDDTRPTVSQNSNGSRPGSALGWQTPLVKVHILWLLLVSVGLPLYARWAHRTGDDAIQVSELRGLNLPRGSVRSMLALLVVGSFIIVLVLGGPVLEDNFEEIVTAFGTLSGSIIGFYFAHRGAAPLPNRSNRHTDQ